MRNDTFAVILPESRHAFHQGYRNSSASPVAWYVDGQIHTNGIENFWSLLKRGIKGTYVSVEPFHLFRYPDEQAFRFNTRQGKDADRFVEAVGSIMGKRLTFDELTGKKLSH